jgi:hypothetical protein
VVVHGRHSHEHQPHSNPRRRLIVTGRVSAIAADPSNVMAAFWNPAGASFEQALAALGTPCRNVGVIGGMLVFGMFLNLYDVFHLSRVSNVWLPGGRPVFSDVPRRTPEDVLEAHGMERCQREALDPTRGVTLTSWQRAF